MAEGSTTASKIPPLRDTDQFPYACYPTAAAEIKKEPLDSFYPPCRNALGSAVSRHSQGWNSMESSNLDSLAQVSLDAEFGLSFYDPYVSEPSLDLSPYLEDIDLDTNQQAEIFDLVSASPPKYADMKAVHHNFSRFENEIEPILDEGNGFAVEYNRGEAFASQTVPCTVISDCEWLSCDSSAPPSPQLPSDARKLKNKRQRGRKNSGSKAYQMVDKNTYEYRLKRERNNVAVRKSRMKTKEKHVEIFRKANQLTEENEDLQSVVASLTEELHRLRSFLAKSGISHLDLPIEA